MDPISLAMMGGSLLSGLMGSSAANKAADQQARSAQDQLNFNRGVYSDQKAMFAPWQQMGMQGQQAYNSLLGLGHAPKGFDGYQQSPGYQFQLNQGLDAAKSAAAMHGGTMSGATMQSLNNYGQGVANQDYQTYLNRLQGIGAQGQQAAGMQSGAAQQYGQNGLAAMGSMGDARAAGTVGGYNALMGGINSGIQSYGYMQGAGQGNSLSGLFSGWGQQSGGMAPMQSGHGG